MNSLSLHFFGYFLFIKVKKVTSKPILKRVSLYTKSMRQGLEVPIIDLTDLPRDRKKIFRLTVTIHLMLHQRRKHNENNCLQTSSYCFISTWSLAQQPAFMVKKHGAGTPVDYSFRALPHPARSGMKPLQICTVIMKHI
jgi:hypothetical protein